MNGDYLIAFIEEIEGEVTEVGSSHFFVKFDTNSPISAGAKLLIRDADGVVEDVGDIHYKSMGSGMLSLDKTYFFDGCKVSTLTDRYTFHESYEDALVEFDRVSELSTTHTASLTKVLSSTDYEGEDFSDVPESESRNCEFKETFKWDINKQKSASYLVDKVCQTVSAMMNSEGGEIYVGVDDSRKFTGIDFELRTLYQNDEDLYKRAVQSALIDALGFYAGNFVRFDFLREKEKRIFKIRVPALTKRPTFFKDSQFMIRLDAANRELKGSELFDYLISTYGNRSSTK